MSWAWLKFVKVWWWPPSHRGTNVASVLRAFRVKTRGDAKRSKKKLSILLFPLCKADGVVVCSAMGNEHDF